MTGVKSVPRGLHRLNGRRAGESDWQRLRGVKIRTAAVVAESFSVISLPDANGLPCGRAMRRLLVYPVC